MTSRRSGRWAIATDAELRPRRISLLTRILAASLLLVCAPLAVAWAIGLYDAIETRRITSALDHAVEEAQAQVQLQGLGDPAWLATFGPPRDVWIRVVDRDGATRFSTDPTFAEGRLSRRGWFRGVADYFFGPTGPPDLPQYDHDLGELGRRPEVRAVLEGRDAQQELRITAKMMVYSRAVAAGDGAHVLYLTKISRRSVRALYDFRFQLLKLTLGLLVGALVMGAWLAYQVVNPVRLLERRVQGYLRRGGGGPLTLQRSDEIGDLSRSFDDLRRRLEERIRYSTRVTADFAHDLKNPLAAMRATGELLGADRALDPERRARLARTVEASAVHMERSIDALMELAKLEAQLAEDERVEVDLCELVRQIVAETVDAEPGGPTITVTAPAPASVVANPARLSQAIRNLLDNARIFAARQVEVRVEILGDVAQVVVIDDGPGVSDGNRARIFERFFTQRPEGTPAGTGLGLAIVRAVAHAHGGTIELSEASGAGAEFRMRLPLA